MGFSHGFTSTDHLDIRKLAPGRRQRRAQGDRMARRMPWLPCRPRLRARWPCDGGRGGLAAGAEICWNDILEFNIASENDHL